MKKLIIFLSALMLALSLSLGAAAFVDIEDEATEKSVATLEGMGIVTGTSNTKYSPDLVLTRAQVCTIIVRAMGLESSVEGYANQNLFSDVKGSMWHSGYVNAAYRKGIISGYGNGRFGPDDQITYGQFVTIILRLLGYTESDIGKAWPTDYVTFASEISLDEGLDLLANDTVSRGDAAILLYNVMMTEPKGSQKEFYTTVNGYSSEVSAILLDNAVTDSTAGDLYALVIGNSGAEFKYYAQKKNVSDLFLGSLGKLLLNSQGKVIGFIADGEEYKEIIVDSAKITGITDTSGNVYKIGSSVNVISDSVIYPYNTTGYVKVNSHANRFARFYYDDEGTLLYVYLATGVDRSNTDIVIADPNTPAAMLERAFNIVGTKYKVVKNGVRTTSASIAAYDVAYYDGMTETLHLCDNKITGYIQSVSPSLAAPSSVNVSGCELEVLESAWESLEQFTFGSYVTVLLADNGAVAAFYSAEVLKAEMYGVLSADGNSINLSFGGFVMRPRDISANTAYNGSLVKIDTSDSERVTCTIASKKIQTTDTLNIANNTVCGYPLAAGCAIYEWGNKGYVYSLSGEPYVASRDLSEIYWADSLGYKYISFYHVNAVGEVDVLLLNDVTGNYYDYGYLTYYREGIAMETISYNAMTITNDESPKESKKHICTINKSSGYGGITLQNYSKNYLKVTNVVKLSAKEDVLATAFFLDSDDNWYVSLKGGNIPVSENVKLEIKATDEWRSGEEGLLFALSSGLKISVYYDRSIGTGAKVRVITAE